MFNYGNYRILAKKYYKYKGFYPEYVTYSYAINEDGDFCIIEGGNIGTDHYPKERTITVVKGENLTELFREFDYSGYYDRISECTRHNGNSIKLLVSELKSAKDNPSIYNINTWKLERRRNKGQGIYALMRDILNKNNKQMINNRN